jgi:hypothetical protein
MRKFSGVIPRIKIHHLGPSVNRSTRIFRQLEDLFEPYGVMFKEMKG